MPPPLPRRRTPWTLPGAPGGVVWLRALRRRMCYRAAALAAGLCIAAGAAQLPAARAAPDWELPPAAVRKVSAYGDRLLAEFYPNGTRLCESWLLLPAENIWSTPLRGTLYLLGMLYTFIGIAIISDIFMSAIERITAPREETGKDPLTGEETTRTEPVWNETVANLTLLALGSSAPEIMMSVIETMQTLDTEPGQLGPSTIVGSAAFNLLCIPACCIVTVDGPKRIAQFSVFVITAASSLFAYVWMWIVTMIWTKCVITVPEGLITLACFPVLVLLAYAADRGACGGTEDDVSPAAEPEADPRRIVQQLRDMRAKGGSEQEAAETLNALVTQGHRKHMSRAVYRMNAVRSAFAGRALISSNTSVSEPLRRSLCDSSHPPCVEWEFPEVFVLENCGSAEVRMLLRGEASEAVTVKWWCEDGTAKAGVHYTMEGGFVVFEAGAAEQVVRVPIVDDNQYNPDTHFAVVLEVVGSTSVPGRFPRCTVSIIDDDVPGYLEFEQYHDPAGLQESVLRGTCLEVTAPESGAEVCLSIVRRNGSDGAVSCRLRTRDASAHAGEDYVAADTIVTFDHEILRQVVRIPVVDHADIGSARVFNAALSDPQGGAELGAIAKARVCLTSDPVFAELMERAAQMAQAQSAAMRAQLDGGGWSQRLHEAVTIEGDDLTTLDMVMHFITMFWKVLFCAVPPTEYCGGWCTFVVALGFVGVVTAVVAELARLFGCVVGLSDPVTAITFVALGTSLPDTFASKMAAENEDTADASIGNVTGSNSVNVFLGLGLPWTIASIYKAAKGEDYTYPASDLAFSVILFLCCACTALGLLVGNRTFNGGELGGPHKWHLAAVLFALWVCYVVVSALKVYGHISDDDGGC
eukprot:TRINITY_DN12275_c0_g1_i1.p1 TRINITY_DN12275_c0_g1~~TRINITY_DN12275_c0_g1_i1.p1  ORF type:complete len:900 (+),score=271.01 TRINITY_DN12275_c0_g1_i1:103-2700(+)